MRAPNRMVGARIGSWVVAAVLVASCGERIVETALGASPDVLGRECAGTMNTYVVLVSRYEVPDGGFVFSGAPDASLGAIGCFRCLEALGSACEIAERSLCFCAEDRPATGADLSAALASAQVRESDLDPDAAWCVRVLGLDLPPASVGCACDELDLGPGVVMDGGRICATHQQPIELGSAASQQLAQAICPDERGFATCALGR